MRKKKRLLGERVLTLNEFLEGENFDDYDVLLPFFRSEGYDLENEISETDFQDLKRKFEEIHG
jgi:hypothetical protein